ncbi:Rho-GTPase-activating protein 8, partial [Basidiobolus ranarum]
MLTFENSFWTSDYRSGISRLNEKLHQGSIECEEILGFLKERSSIEEQYGSKLCELGKKKSKNGGFSKDDGASLKRTFDCLKKECFELGEFYKQNASD